MMKRRVGLLLGVMMLVAGCGGLGAIPVEPEREIAPISPPQQPPSAAVPTGEAVDGGPEAPIDSSPPPTLTAWEQTQTVVQRYLGLLSPGDDGHEGLQMALAQAEANGDWCAGVQIGIGQFRYLQNNAAVEDLERLFAENGCQ